MDSGVVIVLSSECVVYNDNHKLTSKNPNGMGDWGKGCTIIAHNLLI